MKKAITITSILAAAFQLINFLYVLINGVIELTQNAAYFAVNGIPGIIIAFARLLITAALVLIIILTNKKGSSAIAAEIIGVIAFSGVFGVFNIVFRTTGSFVLGKQAEMDIVRIQSINSLTGPLGSLLASVSVVLIIAACVLSIVNKKTKSGSVQ